MKIREIFEMTSAGGIASVAMPLGSVKKRRKEQSIYEVGSEDISFKYSRPSSKEEYLDKKKVLISRGELNASIIQFEKNHNIMRRIRRSSLGR